MKIHAIDAEKSIHIGPVVFSLLNVGVLQDSRATQCKGLLNTVVILTKQEEVKIMRIYRIDKS